MGFGVRRGKLPCPQTEGHTAGLGLLWVGSVSLPRPMTSHMLGTGMRLTLMFQRNGSLYLAVGGDKAEAT